MSRLLVAQRAGGAEIEHLPVYRPPIHEGGVAQRSKRDDDRFTAHGIVHDLVPNHNLNRVGPHIAADVHDLNGFKVFEPPVCIAYRLKRRLVDGWDTILGWAAGHNFVEINARAAEIGRP